MLGHLKPRPNAARAPFGCAGPLSAGAPAALAGTTLPPEVSGGSVAVGLSPFALARRCGGGIAPPRSPHSVGLRAVRRAARSLGSRSGLRCLRAPCGGGRPWLSPSGPAPSRSLRGSPPAACLALLLPRGGLSLRPCGPSLGGVAFRAPRARGVRLRARGPGPGSRSGSGSRYGSRRPCADRCRKVS